MKIRHVSIRNFRGIMECDWHVKSNLVCLVGAGGATKTTLLDAVGLALSRTYRPQFTDADFYGCDVSTPISVRVAVTELPESLIEEQALGKDRCGIRPDGQLEHDPIDGTEECLLVRLLVDASLEPHWTVVRPDEDDGGRPISASQRQQLGFFRLGEEADLHLRWGRASALSGMTENRSDAAGVVIEAQREARAAVFGAIPAELQDTAREVQQGAQALGAAPYEELRPGLDPAGSVSGHSLVLHDQNIPLTSEGTGTRRLTSISIQEKAVEGGSVLAIDEIEHGLEPHRLSHFLRHAQKQTSAGRMQMFLTTHSPVTVSALSAGDLAVAACESGKTAVHNIPADLDHVQGTVRSAPTALLGRQVVVAEGSTEVGLVREMSVHWDAERSPSSEWTSITLGLAIVNGRGGARALRHAEIFQRLGYATAAVVDNDDADIDKAVVDAEGGGVKVLRWTKGRALEDEIVACLDDEGLREFVQLATENRGEASIHAAVAQHLGREDLNGVDPFAWIDPRSEEEKATLRTAIAKASKGEKFGDHDQPREIEEKRAWFKREHGGEQLARLLLARRRSLKDQAVAKPLRSLKAFIYPDVTDRPDEK